MRNAEAIGLRVKHIDFVNKQIEISETFARTVRGTNHAARIEKETKMQNTRHLPLSNELSEILKVQIQNKKPDDFVFTSQQGLSIDDRMLQRRILTCNEGIRIWRQRFICCKAFFWYSCNSTRNGLTDLAYLMGHSTVETAMRNYVSVTRQAPVLPTISKTV